MKLVSFVLLIAAAAVAATDFLGKRSLSYGVKDYRHFYLDHPYTHTVQIPCLIAADRDDIQIDMVIDDRIRDDRGLPVRQPEFQGKGFGQGIESDGWFEYIFDGSFTSPLRDEVKLAEQEGPRVKVYYIVPFRKAFQTRAWYYPSQELKIRSNKQQLDVIQPNPVLEYVYEIKVQKDSQGQLKDAKVAEWDTWYIGQKFPPGSHQAVVDYLEQWSPISSWLPWNKVPQEIRLEATSRGPGLD